ncbi:MAG: BMP family ABC transporter substrate-binding protein, partial [Lachnospiraceae bacterium]|nr:BMP family ABC transporter substrate-binding protein [Lachnospiraceae bacterium]
MKKLLSLVLAMCMVFSLAACGNSDSAEGTDYKVAMITDYGDITDQSFNQTTYEACKAFCEENGLEFTYYKPAGDNT